MSRPSRSDFAALVRFAERAQKADRDGDNKLALQALGDLRWAARQVWLDLAPLLGLADPNRRTLAPGGLVCASVNPDGSHVKCILNPGHLGDWHRAVDGRTWEVVRAPPPGLCGDAGPFGGTCVEPEGHASDDGDGTDHQDEDGRRWFLTHGVARGRR